MKLCYGCGRLFHMTFLFFASLWETRYACSNCVDVVKTMPTEAVKKLEVVRDTFYTATFEDQQAIVKKTWKEYQTYSTYKEFDPQELALLLQISQKIPRRKENQNVNMF